MPIIKNDRLAELSRLQRELDETLRELATGSIDDEEYRKRFATIDEAMMQILEPVTGNLEQVPTADLQALLERLPPGFYRSEIRTFLETRKNDSKKSHAE